MNFILALSFLFIIMPLPLEHITILDLTRLQPGPYCTMILADLGAKVIRIEEPRFPYGSPPPHYQKGKYRESAFNSILNRNKKSISLNLKNENALAVFYKLVKKADIVVDTFRPKITNKLKVDYETLSKINPSIICASLTGYGQDGPYEQEPGHDLNYLGICGALSQNIEREKYGQEDQGRKPIVPGVQIADIGGALVCAIGILGAIIERDQNPEKKGQYVDVSMTDSVFSFVPMNAAYIFIKDVNEKPTGFQNVLHGDFPFYSVYKTKDDKFLAIGAIELKFWQELCRGLGREELIPLQTRQKGDKEELFEILTNEFLKRTQKEWLEHFKDYDTCVMPVKTFEEACNDPQMIARNMVEEVEHPVFGKIRNVGSPIKYSRTPLKIRMPAPSIGQHTTEILNSLGYSDKEIRGFNKKKVA
jgi:crotonobetainyl-CoA:carnitine CoA-transferase CaiB-like acyl-CoA transferase